MGAYGCKSAEAAIVFLVGDEAFIKHAAGLVTLRLPLIAVGQVRVDFVSIDESRGEAKQLRPAVENPPESEHIPVLALPALIYLKLKAGRQKDVADVVELLKRGQIDVPRIDRYLEQNAPEQVRRWESAKEIAAREE